MKHDPHLREVKSATLLRFKDLWKHNFEANRTAIQRNPGVQALKNKIKDFPGIVVGAGPSLDKNICHLRRAVGKSVIIASDAALKPLLSCGITPSFVACLDPQAEITKFFKGRAGRGITLVAPSIIHPQVLDLWEGDVVFYSKFAPDIPALVEIQNQAPHLGCLTPGGTVLSIAYDLAFQAGANPILFVGQDLSYPNGRIYSRDIEGLDVDFKTSLHRQRNNVVLETDMSGQTLPTLKSMAVSKQWFHWAFTTWKREHPVEVINCSEAGILTGHCRLMPAKEAIYRHCGKTVNIPWILKKALKPRK